MRDLSKTKYYRCDELGYLARDYFQLRDRMRTTATMVNSESEGDVLEISDKVFTFFSAVDFRFCMHLLYTLQREVV